MDLYYIGIKGRLFNKDMTKDVPDTDFVTHADYRALEEKYALVCKFADEKCEELAALRGKTGDMQ